MKVLITGATGCIGSHLCDYLLENTNDDIYAIKRPRTEAYRPDKVKHFDCDITDFVGLYDVLDNVKPDVIYHLAAQSYPAISFSNPQYTVDVNINGTVNLLEAIRRTCEPQKIILASSAASYGSQQFYPTSEDASFNPESLYGCTKASQDLLGYQYFRNYNLPIVRARFYIIIGERQSANNAVNAFAKQIAEIEKGKRDYLEVGNLSTYRDITDVKDAVRASFLLSEKGIPGEAYNVCSGTPRKMEDILNELISLSDCEIKVRQSSDRLRPSDIPLECGNNEKIKGLGWEPEIDFRETLERVLNYWRKKI